MTRQDNTKSAKKERPPNDNNIVRFWADWYAWRPVRIEGKWIWRKMVQRQIEILYEDDETQECRKGVAYRHIED